MTEEGGKEEGETGSRISFFYVLWAVLDCTYCVLGAAEEKI